MSVYSATNDPSVARRTTNLPTGTAFSFCGWFKLDPLATQFSSNRTFCWIYDPDNVLTPCWVYFGLQDTADNPTLRLHYFDDGGSGHVEQGSLNLTEGVWYFIGGHAGATLLAFGLHAWDAAGTLFEAVTGTGASAALSFTPDSMEALGQFDFSAPLGGWAAHFKTWSANLTQAELRAEQFSAAYVRTANANTGFVGDNTACPDTLSGNSRNWTAQFLTLSGDNPPVSLPDPRTLVIPGRRVLIA